MRADHSFVCERSGVMRIWRKESLSADALGALLAAQGKVLKTSPKSETRRVGAHVLKQSAGNLLVQLVKHTTDRARYRAGWLAALHLETAGVAAPKAYAHVEWGFAGAIWRHVTLYEYLDGFQDVEHYLDVLIAGTLSRTEVNRYFARLADHVNTLERSGAIHTDLAGKNILTRDGETFYFIDLDGILLNTPYTTEMRFKSHVQLYDSFIDRCSDETLAPFIAALLPKGEPFEPWMQRVRAAQTVRRARTVEKWKQEGKIP